MKSGISNRCPNCKHETRYYVVCPKCHTRMESFPLADKVNLKDAAGNEFTAQIINSTEAIRKDGFELSILKLEGGSYVSDAGEIFRIA
jgi:hypothetical protein